MSRNLLLEIGTEEIPAGYLAPACSALESSFRTLLTDKALSASSVLTTHTPRRIVLFAEGIPERQPDRTEEVQGPPARIAFDAEGNPTKAALGFARANKVPVEKLNVKETDSGSYVSLVREIPGRDTLDVLSRSIPTLIAAVPFPKSMHWDIPACGPKPYGGRRPADDGTVSSISFARPIRSLLCLFGKEVVPFEVSSLSTDRLTHGHPFLAQGPVEIPQADYKDYCRRLAGKSVIVDVTERRAVILRAIELVLARHGSGFEHHELLEEVTNLVEFPCAVEGSFDERYLILPEQVIITAMTEHQRYFPVRDAKGKLLARFITVSNRTEAQADEIRKGNERVLVARLNDAEFFWREDRKTPLADKVSKLATVTFQEKLGSYGDRTQRLEELAVFIAKESGQAEEAVERARRAAHLAKADLVTHMVFEFPALQGIMGTEHARADGEDDEVASAIAEHYKPRWATDDEPQTMTGSILALADKFDTLTGCFAVGLIPTGSQDPYGLRRATQGILRIILKQDMVLSLDAIIRRARSLLPDSAEKDDEVAAQVLAFIRDRLIQQFLDSQAPIELIRAALEPGFDDLADFARRLESIHALSATPDWNRLAVAVERTHNITRDFTPTGGVDETLLEADEERKLFELYQGVKGPIAELLDRADYLSVGQLYEETFAEPLHTFFEEVFVNVEDEKLRANRLTLLKLINQLYADRVADLSQVQRKES